MTTLNEKGIGEGATPTEVPIARRPALIYADLVAGVSLGPQVTKISFALATGEPKDGKQPVTTIVDIAMPTAALVEFTQNFLKHSADSADTLLQFNDNIARIFQNLKLQKK